MASDNGKMAMDKMKLYLTSKVTFGPDSYFRRKHATYLVNCMNLLVKFPLFTNKFSSQQGSNFILAMASDKRKMAMDETKLYFISKATFGPEVSFRKVHTHISLTAWISG